MTVIDGLAKQLQPSDVRFRIEPAVGRSSFRRHRLVATFPGPDAMNAQSGALGNMFYFVGFGLHETKLALCLDIVKLLSIFCFMELNHVKSEV